jgi:hypothetical protein
VAHGGEFFPADGFSGQNPGQRQVEQLHALAITPNGTAKAESTHPRIQGQPIVLHHLWVVMHRNS